MRLLICNCFLSFKKNNFPFLFLSQRTSFQQNLAPIKETPNAHDGGNPAAFRTFAARNGGNRPPPPRRCVPEEDGASNYSELQGQMRISRRPPLVSVSANFISSCIWPFILLCVAGTCRARALGSSAMSQKPSFEVRFSNFGLKVAKKRGCLLAYLTRFFRAAAFVNCISFFLQIFD